MSIEVQLNWLGGEHVFALRLGELRGLQEVTGCGPHKLHTRILARDWQVDDIASVLRFGLIGGGMPAAEAGPKVAQAMQDQPLLQFVGPAIEVLSAALIGVKDDPVGKPEGVETPPEPVPEPTPEVQGN